MIPLLNKQLSRQICLGISWTESRFDHNTREMCPTPIVHMANLYICVRVYIYICMYIYVHECVLSRWYIPEQACGGSGNISVVELLRLATAQPKDCGLKLRSCCMKSEHSIRATSAKCRSHRIWFCRMWERRQRKKTGISDWAFELAGFFQPGLIYSGFILYCDSLRFFVCPFCLLICNFD